MSTIVFPSVLVIKEEHRAVGGDIVVGALLSQLQYWHGKDKDGKRRGGLFREGFYWIGRTAKEWMKDCLLTPHQYRRALNTLKQKGLIEVRFWKFNFGRPCNWIRLTTGNPLGGPSENPTVVPVKSPQSLCITETTTETTTESFSVAVSPHAKTPAGEGLVKSDQGKEGMEIIEKVEVDKPEGNTKMAKWVEKAPTGTVDTVMANKVAAGKAAHGDANSPKPFSHVWKELFAELYPQEGYQKGFGVIQASQLKRFRKDMDEGMEVGSERAPQVLEYIMRHWGEFKIEVKADMGGKGKEFPNIPHTGFLLKYRAQALNLYLQSIAKKTKAAGTAKIEQPKPLYSKPEPVEKPFIPEEDDLSPALKAALKKG
jgi:hypothetical protein